MTSHELAKKLLEGEDKLVAIGHFVSHCGDNWWEDIEDIVVVYGEEFISLQEKL